MALLNPSFEGAGTLPGEAAHWTLVSSTSLEVLAGFGAAPEEAWEGFEWHQKLAMLEDVAVVLAFFDAATEGFEDFAKGWVGVFLFELPPAQLVTCPFGGGAVEDCESGWSNAPFLRDWLDVAAVAGVFDGEPQEDFEDAWRWNESFAWAWADVTSSAAFFDAGTQPVEDFENSWSAATTL